MKGLFKDIDALVMADADPCDHGRHLDHHVCSSDPSIGDGRVAR